MVLVLVEHEDGAVDDISLEATTFARDIAEQSGAPLEAVAVGPGADADDVVTTLGTHGIETVHAAVDDRLAAYAPGGWAAALEAAVDRSGADTVVAPGTDRGSEVLARAATRLGVPMVAACTDVTVGDGYEIVRQRWGGSLIEHARLVATPGLFTVVPHEIRAEPADEGEATVESLDPDLSDSDLAVQVERWEESDIEGVPLPEARVVVGGGRGVGGPDGFDQLEELAELLNGTVGSSRAAVNEGWRPHSDQIGQTGARIAPELYILAGISGAVQHWVGAKGSENVLAINTDPEAAIIQKADYAIIADLHEVVPAIIEEIKARKDT